VNAKIAVELFGAAGVVGWHWYLDNGYSKELVVLDEVKDGPDGVVALGHKAPPSKPNAVEVYDDDIVLARPKSGGGFEK